MHSLCLVRHIQKCVCVSENLCMDSTLLPALNPGGHRTQRRIPAPLPCSLSFIIKAMVCSLGMTGPQLPLDLSYGKSFFFLSCLNSVVGEGMMGAQLPHGKLHLTVLEETGICCEG